MFDAVSHAPGLVDAISVQGSNRAGLEAEIAPFRTELPEFAGPAVLPFHGCEKPPKTQHITMFRMNQEGIFAHFSESRFNSRVFQTDETAGVAIYETDGAV